jgi:hypothetical protein
MLIESGINIKNIPIYDNIKEVVELSGGVRNAPEKIFQYGNVLSE